MAWIKGPILYSTRIKPTKVCVCPQSLRAADDVVPLFAAIELLRRLSKSAQKKLLKQQKWEAKKAEKKALEKEQKKREGERKRKEWEERLASVSEEERGKLIESRKSLRKERMEQRSEERERNTERLSRAKECGQKIVIDLEFSHLMTPAEINSLVQQIMYCYAVNKRCREPGHLWLTGCKGEMGTQLKRLPGFDNWIIEKEDRSYMEALEDEKQNLQDIHCWGAGGSESVERDHHEESRGAGHSNGKASHSNYLNMSSSQVLTVNQVIEILLKFLETKNWKDSFFQVIPQRKRCQADSEQSQQVKGEKMELTVKRKMINLKAKNSVLKTQQIEGYFKHFDFSEEQGLLRIPLNPMDRIDTKACLEAGQLREKQTNYEPSVLSIKKPIFVFFKNTITQTEGPPKVKGEESEREGEEKMPLGEFVDFILQER
ncbi:hypothetical protein Prudu_010657 [Prunus dulcis]|uniref:tRNA (guanine(9)-N(1))-methyltransferase n=1 Tax=Prunus dulcis TaxID=3755 RepID=A0A4Y1R8T4_PRUDU|nr:hypothetical protein Prudu_010657 [Prunus dulcis]